MSDFAPGSQLHPRVFVIQFNPETGELMESALTYDVKLNSGEFVHGRQALWLCTEQERAELDRVMAKMLADIRAAKGLEAPKPPPADD